MKRFNAITLALASSFFIAPIASAQQGSEAESVEEVIQVVGSRLSMRTATDGSAPVDILVAKI